MDVRCPQCDTTYELDPEQVKRNSVTLKCSQCQHVFRYKIPDISEENQRRWMIRSQQSGDVLYLSGLDSVHQRIMDRSIDRTDEISRTGDKWVTLESVGEFTPVFQVIDSIESLAPSTPKPSVVPGSAPPPPERVLERRRAATAQQFGPNEKQIQAFVESGEFGTPDPAGLSAPSSAPKVTVPEQFRTRQDSEVTQRARPSNKTPMSLPPDPPAKQTAQRAVSNTESINVPWTENSEASYRSNLETSSSRAWIGVVVALIAVSGGIYFVIQSDMFKRDQTVIALGEEPQENPIDFDPASNVVQKAITSGDHAAIQQRDETWANLMNGVQPPVQTALEKALGAAAAEAEGGNVDRQLTKAQSALERGNLPAARRLFKKVLELEPRNSEAITGLAWTHLELGDSGTAAREFKRALGVNPSYGDAYIGLGQANRQLGNIQAAYDAYDGYLGRHPSGSKASIAKYQMEQLGKQLNP